MKVALKKAVSPKGVMFAVIVEKDDYGVWKKDAKKWSQVKLGLGRYEAFNLFNRNVSAH